MWEMTFRRGAAGMPFSDLDSFISQALAKMDGAAFSQGVHEGEVQRAFYAAATASLPNIPDTVLHASEVALNGEGHARRNGAMDFTLLIDAKLFVLELLMFGNRRAEHLERCVWPCAQVCMPVIVRTAVRTFPVPIGRFAPGGECSSVGASELAVIEFDVEFATRRRRPVLHEELPAFHYLVRLARRDRNFVWEVTRKGQTRVLKLVGRSRANSTLP